MELIYQTDSYVKEFTAAVAGLDADQHGFFSTELPSSGRRRPAL
jgi:hypothetical protein